MGFEFEIHYKEGSTNKAVDASSRKTRAELLSLFFNSANHGLLDHIKLSWTTDPSMHKLISEQQTSPLSHPKFSWQNEELRRKGKTVVGNNVELKTSILN